jgi:hypothetical protein
MLNYICAVEKIRNYETTGGHEFEQVGLRAEVIIKSDFSWLSLKNFQTIF